MSEVSPPVDQVEDVVADLQASGEVRTGAAAVVIVERKPGRSGPVRL